MSQGLASPASQHHLRSSLVHSPWITSLQIKEVGPRRPVIIISHSSSVQYILRGKCLPLDLDERSFDPVLVIAWNSLHWLYFQYGKSMFSSVDIFQRKKYNYYAFLIQRHTPWTELGSAINTGNTKSLFLYERFEDDVNRLLQYTHPKKILPVWPRSSDPFYVVTYYIQWVTTSWTHSTCE